MSFTKYNPGYLMLRYLPQLSSTLEYEQKTTSNNYPIFSTCFQFHSHSHRAIRLSFSRGFGILGPKEAFRTGRRRRVLPRPGVSPWPEVAVWRFPRLELELQEEPAWGKSLGF